MPPARRLVEDRQLKPRGARASLALLWLPVAAALAAPGVRAEEAPRQAPIVLQIPGLPPISVPAEAPPPAPAEPPPGPDRNQVHREAVETFEQLDVDHDGGLQQVETFNLAAEVFASADRDGDGRLTIVEWVDARFAEFDAATPATGVASPAPAAPPGAAAEPAGASAATDPTAAAAGAPAPPAR